MLYIIGLGLDVLGISKNGLDIAKKCKKIYIESYTVNFPYSLAGLEDIIGKKIAPADRDFIESMKIIDEAIKTDVALLVYGSPLTATTHITLVEEAKRSKVKTKTIYNASVLDAVAETGLQIYKFGKTASMPNFDVDSYMEVVKDNQKIKAHSLILIDIGMGFQIALDKLTDDAEKNEIDIDKIIVCSRLGTDSSRIYYGAIDDLRELEVRSPFCFIIPSEMHFMEKEVLESFLV